MTNPKVSIIILQYNNSQDTIRCLNSVKELDYSNYNVIVVDNGSNVKSADEIRGWIEKERNSDFHTKYEILDTKYNSGYSGGNNIGIKYALKRGVDYVFILNPDTTIDKNALTKLLETAELDPNIGILGPVINENGKIVYGGQIKWLRPELQHLSLQAYKLTNLQAGFYVPGAAMLIKKEVVKKIGLFDERYFLYFEDADYCERAKWAGYKLAIVPQALVHHRLSSSTSSLGTPLLLRYHYRNAHLFNWKNGPFGVKFLLPFWSIFIIIKQLLKIAFAPSKREISRAILAGVRDFYRGRFGHITDPC